MAVPALAAVELEFDAPPELAPVVARLRQWQPERLEPFARLLGLGDRGSAIRVVVALEGSPAARDVPPWIAGYARGDRAVVVLMPARVPAYPYSSLEELLGHEVAHVLVARAAGFRPVPRWFNEGLAMTAEQAWRLTDRSHAALAMMDDGRYRLTDLDSRFAGGATEAARAYALSAAFVRFLVREEGSAAPAAILERVAREQPFETAFAQSTGRSLAELETAFWRSHRFWTRWIPVLTSGNTLWVAIALLALLAVKRRRDRRRELEERWASEERAEASAEADDRDLVN